MINVNESNRYICYVYSNLTVIGGRVFPLLSKVTIKGSLLLHNSHRFKHDSSHKSALKSEIITIIK